MFCKFPLKFNNQSFSPQFSGKINQNVLILQNEGKVITFQTNKSQMSKYSATK